MHWAPQALLNQHLHTLPGCSGADAADADAAVTAASGEVCRPSSSVSTRLVTCMHTVIDWTSCKQDSFEKVQVG